MKTVLAALALTMCLCPSALAQDPKWRAVSERLKTEGGWVEVSLMIPPGFGKSGKAPNLPFWFRQNGGPGASGSVTILSAGAREGDFRRWREWRRGSGAPGGSAPDEFLRELMDTPAGMERLGSRILSHRCLPAGEYETCWHNPEARREHHRQVIRLVVSQDSLIDLGCGFFSDSVAAEPFGALRAEVCAPFFDSLEVK
jgi:hypothetical protein